MKRVMGVTVCLFGMAAPAWAYIDASPTLGRAFTKYDPDICAALQEVLRKSMP
jgi:hypothetical protein